MNFPLLYDAPSVYIMFGTIKSFRFVFVLDGVLSKGFLGKSMAKSTKKEQMDKLAAGQQAKIELPDFSEINLQSEAHDPKRTLGSMMGEIVWLMSQSPTHKHSALADLEWMLMPAILLGQYKLYRDGSQPVGAALWGYLSEEAEQRMKTVGRLAPQDWGNNAKMDPEQGLIPNEGGTLWLVEMVTPFHNESNRYREQIIADLMQTAFKEKKFKLMHINPETNQREEIILG